MNDVLEYVNLDDLKAILSEAQTRKSEREAERATVSSALDRMEAEMQALRRAIGGDPSSGKSTRAAPKALPGKRLDREKVFTPYVNAAAKVLPYGGRNPKKGQGFKSAAVRTAWEAAGLELPDRKMGSAILVWGRDSKGLLTSIGVNAGTEWFVSTPRKVGQQKQKPKQKLLSKKQIAARKAASERMKAMHAAKKR